MLSSLRNLILVTFCLLISCFAAWFILRGYGYSKLLLEPVQHPFIQALKAGHPLVISYSGESGFPDNTIEGFDAALKKNPDAALWADVRPAADGTLMVFREMELSLTTDGNGWVDYTAPAEIQKLNAGFRFKDADGKNPFADHPVRIPTLVQLLEHFPTQKLVLNFFDNRPGLDDKIVDALEKFKTGPRVLIQSAEEGLLRDLRERKPDWIFGTSQARTTQLKMLAAIGLEALAPLKGDIYVTEVSIGRNVMLDDEMRAELLRRKMPIFIGPIQDKSLANKMLKDGVAGIITKNVLVLVQ